MADAPTPTTSAPAKAQTEYKVTDAADGVAFLELDDGRHVQATIKDGVEGVKRGSHVKITSDGLDKEGAPKEAVVTALVKRD
jgi:hypothetical protein